MDPTQHAVRRMEIARRVVQAYQSLPGLDSFAVGGSTARGNADEFSDIEIWMTYSVLPDESLRRTALQTICDLETAVFTSDLGGGIVRAESLVVSAIEVALLPGTNDDLLSIGTDLGKHLGQPSEKGTADFHDCVVLYDPYGFYKTIRDRLAVYPVELAVMVARNCLRNAVKACAFDIPRAFRNNNWMQLLESRSLVQESLLRIVFALNHDYFPRVKDAAWLLDTMRIIPTDFSIMLNRIAREKDIAQLRMSLVALIQDVVALLDEHWPEALEQKTIDWLDKVTDDLKPIP